MKKGDKKKRTRKIPPIKDPRSDFYRVARKFHLPLDFPKGVYKELESIPTKVQKEEIKNRVDLRKELIFTIDGEDAKDFDDAVSLSIDSKHYILGVHIADVSYYVKPGTRLDKEAFKRGNSTYLINKVIPMLPEKLSNGICSLNPNVDRLTLSVLMWINKNTLEIDKYEIFESVIRSKYRLTYEYVEEVIKGRKKEKDAELYKTLMQMYELAMRLRENRISKGSIDFNFKELKVILDENDFPVDFIVYDRMDSERIIEEFMLLANKTVARLLSKYEPTIYRVHEEPDKERLTQALKLIEALGVEVPGKGEDINSKVLQNIISNVSKEHYSQFVNYLLLRSMKQAKYSTENIGHYGLGFEFYTHFTSPIRRYTDLVIHRLVKRVIKGIKKRPRSLRGKNLKKIAQHTSETERNSMDAERLIVKLKGIRFLENRKEEVFDGIITSLREDGFFVELLKYGIEGFVLYSYLLDDYYEFLPDSMVAVGRSSGRKYRLGDIIKVKLKKADLRRMHLDFVPLTF